MGAPGPGTARPGGESSEEREQRAHLRWVLAESGEFPDLPELDRITPDDVVPMGGGVDAATYLVHGPSRSVVLKLNRRGLEAEAHALRAWRPYSDLVPEVLGVGTVPSTGDEPVRYLVLEALENERGGVVETGDDLLEEHPSRARELGRAIGAELHRLHGAIDRTGFGNFADLPGSERIYDTWGGYLEDFFRHHTEFVAGLGIPDDRIEAACAYIRTSPAVAEGRVVHGDVTIRNVAVYRYDPITVGLFDPNPLVGDPSWDVAPLVNNVAFGELGSGGAPSRTLVRDRELLAGFRSTYPGEIAGETLRSAQLVQAALQAEHRQDRVRRGEADEPVAEATRAFIRVTIGEMTS
jgi:aminoglycoside phosphotransferase (APT) family kinase protein